MGNIKFYLNTGKGTEANRPIIASYHFLGKRLIYFTGLHIGKAEFNKASKDKPAKANCIDAIYINNRLKMIRNYIGEIENEALAGGEALTPEYFRAKLNERLKPQPVIETPQPEKITLLKYFDIFIENTRTRTNQKTGRKLSEKMPIRYKTVKKTLTDFFDFDGKIYDFEDINEDFHKGFTSFMLNEKNYSANYFGRMLKFVKTVIGEATKAGLNTNLYYLNLKGLQEAAESIYLNDKELELIYKLDLSQNIRLEKVRDLFLIGCNTGLRFSDYSTIKKEDIQDNRLRIVAQKTNRKVIIPLMLQAKEIFQKYDFQLPAAISNQKFNEYLKEVAELAGLTDTVITHITKGGKATATKQQKFELVTSHVARRSFATNYYKMGIDKLEIMAITGHKTEAEFLKYIKVTQEEKADSFEKNVKAKQKTQK